MHLSYLVVSAREAPAECGNMLHRRDTKGIVLSWARPFWLEGEKISEYKQIGAALSPCISRALRAPAI